MSDGNYYLQAFGPAEYADIARLVHECDTAIAAYDALRAQNVSDDEAEKRTKWYRAARQLNSARRSACKAFAEARGWKVAERFPLRELRRRFWRDLLPVPWDHACLYKPDFFLDANGEPVAVVAHTGRSAATCARFADREHLHAEMLNDSWFDAGRARAVLYTRI